MEDILEDQLTIEEKAETELKMLKGATEAWIAKGNPKPIRVPVTWWLIIKEYGPTVVTLVISLLGAMYISSVRVGVLMEISQINLIAKYVLANANFDVGSAGNAEWIRWTAMMAFEGALVSFGLREGSKMQDQQFSKWAMWSALSVTVVAGILAGLQLDDSWPTLQGVLTTGFSVLSGVGAPVVVIFASQNVGFLLKEVLGMNKKHDKDWTDAIDMWKVGFDGYFPTYTNQLFGEERRADKLYSIIKRGATSPAAPQRPPERKGLTKDIRRFLRENDLMASEIGDTPQHRMKTVTLADKMEPPLTKVERKNLYTILARLRDEETQGKI